MLEEDTIPRIKVIKNNDAEVEDARNAKRIQALSYFWIAVFIIWIPMALFIIVRSLFFCPDTLNN